MRTISFGIVDQRPVFMDERTDTYFTLDPASEERLRRSVEQAQPLACDADLLDILGVENEPAELIRARFASPSKSLLEGTRHRPSPLTVLKIAGVVRGMRSRLRAQPIETVLRDILIAPSPRLGSDPLRREMIFNAGQFLSARRFIPLARNCLLDSLSLMQWLGEGRDQVALLFGVKFDPFAAHCWVQADRLVVNDHVETVSAFTPVRVIRCSQLMV